MKVLEELNHKIIVKDGQEYEIIAYSEPMDLTDQNNGINTRATHVLKGFDEDLLLVVEDREPDDVSIFYFAQRIGKTGLIVYLKDIDIHNKANELLIDALQE